MHSNVYKKLTNDSRESTIQQNITMDYLSRDGTGGILLLFLSQITHYLLHCQVYYWSLPLRGFTSVLQFEFTIYSPFVPAYDCSSVFLSGGTMYTRELSSRRA